MLKVSVEAPCNIVRWKCHEIDAVEGPFCAESREIVQNRPIYVSWDQNVVHIMQDEDSCLPPKAE